MKVIVNSLNTRSAPVLNLVDKTNVIGVVKKGFNFESVSEILNNSGKWYQDRNDSFYWGGGLEIVATENVAEAGIKTTAAASALLSPPEVLPGDMPVSQKNCIKCTEWMKANFEATIIAALANTPFDAALIYAIACQETAQRWLLWIDTHDTTTVLQRCVFDASGDFPNSSRNAFPKNKAAFSDVYKDAFTQMLVDEANKMRAMPQPGKPEGYAPADYLYKGYGIFQYDLQHVKTNESFFKDKLWYSIDSCLRNLIKELNLKRNIFPNDIFSIVKAYNGSGAKAEMYAKRVAQFYTWIRLMD